MTQSVNYPTTPPKIPLNYPTSRTDPKPPNITHCESPHGSHGPKQGNPCPNSKNNSWPSLSHTTHSVKGHPKNPTHPLPSPISKSNPKPTNTTLCESPHGSHGLKQGNPCPNSKIKFQPLPNKMTQLEIIPNPP